jgi:hypothetical protein
MADLSADIAETKKDKVTAGIYNNASPVKRICPASE